MPTPVLPTSPASPVGVRPIFGTAPAPGGLDPNPPLFQPESPFRRATFALLLTLLLACYAWCLASYWNPAHPGVDQNGYLVGGKLIATTGHYGFIPDNPFVFVGSMWNLGPDDKTFYPKYPLGLPALYAACIYLLGEDRGTVAAHMISPVSTVLAVLGTYLLARPYVGGFGAILTSLLVACSSVTLSLANNPNSHASTLAFTTLGMAMVLSWWRQGGWWRAALAGLLCGYALTIRYTEGLLLLPMVFVFLDRWFSRRRHAYWEGLLMAGCWTLPVAALVYLNLQIFGSPTGYDSTRESTGFAWNFFQANWDLMLREMNDKGLSLTFGLALAGLAALAYLRPAGWKLAAVLALWTIPCLLTYTAYYWAPEAATTVAYSRFFLTIIPGLALAAVFLLLRVPELLRGGRVWWGSVLCGGVVALAAAGSASFAADTMIPDSRQNLLVAQAADRAKQAIARQPTTAPSATRPADSATTRKAPARPIVFSDPRLLHHLHFVTDFDLYTADAFTRGYIDRLAQQAEVTDVHPIQPQRAQALHALLKDKTEPQLIAEQNRIMDEALAAGRGVYFIYPVAQITPLRRRLLPDRKYDAKVIDTWQEPQDFRRNRWDRAGGPPPTWAAGGARRRNVDARPQAPAQVWQLLQITPKPPPPPPAATRAATRATTRPAPPATMRQRPRQ